MKTTVIYTIAFFILCLTGMKCEKNREQLKEALPEATREGKNTFGFLLDGDVWVPKGPLLRSKLDLSYDPDYKGGTFNIVAKRYLENDKVQSLAIGSYNVNSVGSYSVRIDGVVVIFNDINNCHYLATDTQTGTLVITKLDLTAKIISGTFSFKLEKDGCPTINATDGRFDMRIE